MKSRIRCCPGRLKARRLLPVTGRKSTGSSENWSLRLRRTSFARISEFSHHRIFTKQLTASFHAKLIHGSQHDCSHGKDNPVPGIRCPDQLCAAFFFFAFDQRARIAFCAIVRRSSGVSFSCRAFAPKRPRATALGFFSFLSDIGQVQT